MTTIIRSPLAQADIDDIAYRIGIDNLSAMRRWLERLDDAYSLLARFPNSGAARPELSTGLRSFPIGSYLIFYFIMPDEVRIARVIHGARDLKAIFSE